jgi:hypothetical protein
VMKKGEECILTAIYLHRKKSARNQGCQIFLATTNQNWEKYTKWL